MAHVLGHAGKNSFVFDFEPYGYDERQYCSPGFNLPVGLFQRSKFGSFPEYHTSADNLDFIRPEHLAASLHLVWAALNIVESDCLPTNTKSKAEPQLGRYGLYSSVGGDGKAAANNMALLWVLNLADGAHSLLDIAERADLPFMVIADAARRLQSVGLLEGLRPSAMHTLGATQ